MLKSCLWAVLSFTIHNVCLAGYTEDYIAIRQTLNTYPLAIDSKDFGLLSEVFTTDVVANYSAPLNVLTGLAQVEAVLEQSLAPVNTQHALTTQKIDLHGNTANSTTYYTASHFGRGEYYGQVLYAYGKYVDQLVRVDGPGDYQGGLPQWRVQNRTLIYMGPNIGNVSIFSGPTS